MHACAGRFTTGEHHPVHAIDAAVGEGPAGDLTLWPIEWVKVTWVV
jgi:hypothetical protein